MKFMDKDDSSPKRGSQSDSGVSFLDINQFELAVINHTLKNEKNRVSFSFVSFDKLPATTLKKQKRNLENLLRKFNRKYDSKSLAGELGKILSGEKCLPIRCFPPLFEGK